MIQSWRRWSTGRRGARKSVRSVQGRTGTGTFFNGIGRYMYVGLEEAASEQPGRVMVQGERDPVFLYVLRMYGSVQCSQYRFGAMYSDSDARSFRPYCASLVRAS